MVLDEYGVLRDAGHRAGPIGLLWTPLCHMRTNTITKVTHTTTNGGYEQTRTQLRRAARHGKTLFQVARSVEPLAPVDDPRRAAQHGHDADHDNDIVHRRARYGDERREDEAHGRDEEEGHGDDVDGAWVFVSAESTYTSELSARLTAPPAQAPALLVALVNVSTADDEECHFGRQFSFCQ